MRLSKHKRKVITRPTLRQCAEWLALMLPHARRAPMNSYTRDGVDDSHAATV